MSKMKKLADLNKDEKEKVRKVTLTTFTIVILVCAILVGCFACKQAQEIDPQTVMTDEQKANYWKSQIIGVDWKPMTDASHDGILKGLYLPRDAKTDLDGGTGSLVIMFMYNESDVMDSALVVLSSESGQLRFATEEVWTVKFSEKNEVLYMTITDSNEKTVYYQQK